MKFLDEAKIYLQSGKGGNGCASFRREKFIEYGGPDGGDGGNGGDIVFKCVTNRNTLIDFRFKQHFKAKSGKDGSGKRKKGAQGDSVLIEVPQGTSIYNDDKSVKLLELKKANEELVFLKGGNGGFGNYKFKSSKNISPRTSNPGYPGKEMWVRLRMNLIADVGIIGLPNVGKSSFLKSTTRANPKIANYPFTTLAPNLGVVSFDNYDELVIADIPGIIKNANKGIGLGLKFLGHVEKCNLLLHFLDINDKHILKNYKNIRKELRQYGKSIEEKEEIIVLTKSDLCDEDFTKKQLAKINSISKNKTCVVSIKYATSIKNLITILFKEKKIIEKPKKNKWSP